MFTNFNSPWVMERTQGWTLSISWKNGIMGDVIPFKKVKLSEKHKGNTLCKSGFHKWQLEKQQLFDSKKGKLITVYTCLRCGVKKNSTH